MRSKVTLKELAKLLNVSVSTVSKALNDSPEISPKTIDRVKELAALRKYKPNPTAVNLKSSKSGTIAVIVPNISNAFFAKVMSGIEEKAREEGLQVITYISNESYEREKQIIDMVSGGFVDGVLIAPAEETLKKKDFQHLKELLEYELPVVLYDRVNIELPVDKIGVDDKESIYEGTQIFIKNGIKQIALVSAIQHLDVGSLRIQGFQKATEEKHVQTRIVASEDVADLKEKIADLLKEGVTGIICTDIISTLLTARVAHEKNISIPGALRILGYVDEDTAQFLSPSLSYIDQHPKRLGKTALEVLSSRINKTAISPYAQTETLKTDFVHLESTSFPEQGGDTSVNKEHL